MKHDKKNNNHSEKNHNTLNDIIKILKCINRDWHKMENYDKVSTIGASASSLNLLTEKIDKEKTI